MSYSIEIDLNQKTQHIQNEIDLLIILKTINYSEIILRKSERLTIKFDSKYDYQHTEELVKNMGIKFQRKHNRLVSTSIPPASHLKYKYPASNTEIVNEMVQLLSTNVHFYTQTLHLMNKMNIRPPETMLKQITMPLDDDGHVNNVMEIAMPPPKLNFQQEDDDEDDDSEIEETIALEKSTAGNLFKRKSHLPKIENNMDKRIKCGSTTFHPTISKTTIPVKEDEIFSSPESTPVPKQIKFKEKIKISNIFEEN